MGLDSAPTISLARAVTDGGTCSTGPSEVCASAALLRAASEGAV